MLSGELKSNRQIKEEMGQGAILVLYAYMKWNDFQPKRFFVLISKEKEGFSAAAIYVLLFCLFALVLFLIFKSSCWAYKKPG